MNSRNMLLQNDIKYYRYCYCKRPYIKILATSFERIQNATTIQIVINVVPAKIRTVIIGHAIVEVCFHCKDIHVYKMYVHNDTA